MQTAGAKVVRGRLRQAADRLIPARHRPSLLWGPSVAGYGCARAIGDSALKVFGEARPGPGDRGDMAKSRGEGDVDLAALLGAAIVVLLTLTLAPGPWGPISTIVGLLVLCMLFAFFWGQHPKSQSRPVNVAALVGAVIVVTLTLAFPPGVLVRTLIVLATVLSALVIFLWRQRDPLTEPKELELKSLFVAVALCIVVGLVAALTLAQAVQWLRFGDSSDHLSCRDAAVAEATMAVRDLSETMSATGGANGTGASPTPLPTLVQNTLADGTKYLENINEKDSLGSAFQHAYEDAIGGCLAGEAFESLWWVGVPLAVLTLVWWEPELQEEVRWRFRGLPLGLPLTHAADSAFDATSAMPIGEGRWSRSGVGGGSWRPFRGRSRCCICPLYNLAVSRSTTLGKRPFMRL